MFLNRSSTRIFLLLIVTLFFSVASIAKINGYSDPVRQVKRRPLFYPKNGHTGMAKSLQVKPYSLKEEVDSFQHITILQGNNTNNVEQRILDLLANRLNDNFDLQVDIVSQKKDGLASTDSLLIIIGQPNYHKILTGELQKAHIQLPGEKDPGPEGFLLKTVSDSTGHYLLAAASDERGVLYAVGEILRQLIPLYHAVGVPELDIRTAPAFEVRGTEVSQGNTMRNLTGARSWSEEEWEKVVLDYALAGANTFALGHASPDRKERYEFIKSYGLKTLTSLSPNQGSGPSEWKAMEAIGRKGYLCPSIPKARQAILKQNEARWKKSVAFDYVRMYSGDGGGCECEKCASYGKTYIHMCEELANIIHKYHPETRIFATNQKLDNAGDQAVFAYLNQKSRSWLTAICYGPGSNAMSWQPGRRQDHRTDLYRYPAFGEYDRYLREMLQQLPPDQSIVFFTDLTHWVYSQYGLVDYAPIPDKDQQTPPYWSQHIYNNKPDPALAMVYDRRTFYARPKHYHHIFTETMRYGIGDVTYSEGHHDVFNQWMWQRLLWAPHKGVQDVVTEFARTWFGPEAAPLMVEAIFQLEKNLSAPLAKNHGIDSFYYLVEEAGRLMPPDNKSRNYLWLQYMQKAALDKYCQLKLRLQMALERKVTQELTAVLQGGHLDKTIEWASQQLAQEDETIEMLQLKEMAKRLGEESNRLYGVRNEGYFNLEQDFIGLGWLTKQIEQARKAPNSRKKFEIVSNIIHYDDPGEGGYYDDAGNPLRSPHLVYGWPFTDASVSTENRLSQRTMAFTTDKDRGLTFQYENLDSTASYQIRFSLVRPVYASRFASFQTQKTESIYADDYCLIKDLELPKDKCEFFEFSIPRHLTRDGSLTIRFQKSAGVGEGSESKLTVWRNTGGWGTLVSEVWLYKNDNKPHDVR